MQLLHFSFCFASS